MFGYVIDKEQYEAVEAYLLAYKPKGFMQYKTKEDVKKAVEGLLETIDTHHECSWVSSGGLFLLCDEDKVVELYVDPVYRHRYISQILEPRSTVKFKLV